MATSVAMGTAPIQLVVSPTVPGLLERVVCLVGAGIVAGGGLDRLIDRLGSRWVGPRDNGLARQLGAGASGAASSTRSSGGQSAASLSTGSSTAHGSSDASVGSGGGASSA